MTWSTAKPWLGTVVRLVVGAIWIWAAIPKLASPQKFILAVRAYDATPEWLSQAIAYGLPVLEFCLGVLLIVGVAVRVAAATSAALFVVFLIGLVQAAARGLKLACGCFGGGGQTLQTAYTLDILRDIGLLILAAYLVVWSSTKISIEQWLERHDHVEAPSAKRMRTTEGRRKYEAAVAAKTKAARDRWLYVNSSLAIVVVLVSFIGIGVQGNRAKVDNGLTIVNASAQYGVAYGAPAAATVVLYEDFQCPNCRLFEEKVAKTLDADVKANKARVEFRPVAILDSSANDNYSTRAANAALCASDVSVDYFVKYHNYLYGKDAKGQLIQPPEQGPGRTDKQLIAYAKTLKLPKNNSATFQTCVATGKHNNLVEALTDRASKHGVNATPTVLVNGKKLKSLTLAALKRAIAAADAKGPKPSKSPVPSASKTATGTASPTASTAVSSTAPASSSAPASPAAPSATATP